MFRFQQSDLPPYGQWGRLLKAVLLFSEELPDLYGFMQRLSNSDSSPDEFRERAARFNHRMLELLHFLKGPARLFLNYPRTLAELLPDSLAESAHKHIMTGLEPVHLREIQQAYIQYTGDKVGDKFIQVDEFGFAGDLAQAHAARLKTGESVELEVRYPKIQEIIKSDFGLLLALFKSSSALLGEEFEASSLDSLQQLMIEGCDAEIEACNFEELTSIWDDTAALKFVTPDPELSTDKVIVRARENWRFCHYDFDPIIRKKAAQTAIKFVMRCLIKGQFALVDFRPDAIRVGLNGQLFLRSAKLLQRLNNTSCKALSDFLQGYMTDQEDLRKQAIQSFFTPLSDAILTIMDDLSCFLASHFVAKQKPTKIDFAQYRHQLKLKLKRAIFGVAREAFGELPVRVVNADFWAALLSMLGLCELMLTFNCDYQTELVELPDN